MSAERRNVPAVVETATLVTTPTLHGSLAVPAMIAEAGDRAARRFLDFFAASIENDNTRMGIVKLTCRGRNGYKGSSSAHAAAIASCHWFAASARKIRSVDRETRWRWRLKVLWTAACMLRKH